MVTFADGLGHLLKKLLEKPERVARFADEHPRGGTLAVWVVALVLEHFVDVGAELLGGPLVLVLPATTAAAAGAAVVLYRRHRADAHQRPVFAATASAGLAYSAWYAYPVSPWLQWFQIGVLVAALVAAFRGSWPHWYRAASLVAVLGALGAAFGLPRARVTPLRAFCPRTLELDKVRKPDGDLRYLNAGCDSKLELKGAHLEGADLRNANLSEADLTGALFPCADLSGATLEHITANGACLRRATLVGASLGRSASDTDSLDLTCANLSYARVSDLRGALLVRVLAEHTAFHGSLHDSDLSGGDFIEARFDGRSIGGETSGKRPIDGARGDDATLLPPDYTVLLPGFVSGPPGSAALKRVVGPASAGEHGEHRRPCPPPGAPCDPHACE